EKRVDTKCVTVIVSNSIVGSPSDNAWYLDSGCTLHLTNDLGEITNSFESNARIHGPFGESINACLPGEDNLEIKQPDESLKLIKLPNTIYDNKIKRK